METILELLQSPAIIITVLVIGSICETLRRLVHARAGDSGLRGVFFVLSTGKTPDSQGLLPIMLCLPLCFIPWLPPAECLTKPGFEFAARIGTYLFAGVYCKIGYDLVMGTVMGAIRHAGARQTSTPPPPDPPS